MSFRIDPSLPLDDEIRRVIAEEAGAATAILNGTANGRHEDLHDARKRLKRLRGVLKLVQPGDGAFCVRENARYRDVAKSLSAARDAGALVETVDRFLDEFGHKRSARELAAVRGALMRRRDRIVHEHENAETTVSAAVASLKESIDALSGLNLPHDRKHAAATLEKGVNKTLAKAVKALKRAHKRGDPEDFHELRKAVKYHWMHLGLLREVWPGKAGKRRKAMNALGDLLGELNDIDVMRALFAVEGDALAAPAERDAFEALMKRKEKALRGQCIAQASHLFDLSPKKTAAAVERRYLKSTRRADPHLNTAKAPVAARADL